MPLIINQGIQDITKDTRFDPIVEPNVMMAIKKITLSERFPMSIDITFQILGGKNKNRFIFDTVTYDPDSPFSWKYRSLRASAGAPYQKGESPKIDIEALLLNKAVLCDLSIRKSKKDGEDREFQNITFKVAKAVPKMEQDSDVEEFDDIDEADGVEESKPKAKPKTKPKPKPAKEIFEEDDFVDEDDEDEEEEMVEEVPKAKKVALPTKTKAKKTVKPKVTEEVIEEDEVDSAFENSPDLDEDDDW